MNENIKDKIGEILLSYGITEWGICPFESVLPLLECRAMERIPQNAKSIIVCLFPYKLTEYPDNLNLSKYAVVKDYHTVTAELLTPVSEKLKELFGGEYAVFADNSPIREVKAASLAGLGRVGLNKLIINDRFGSYVFIGEIVTTLDIGCEVQKVKNCIMCRECMRKCPGGAIGENGIDTDKCLSHITQKKGELTECEEKLIAQNGTIWGCDVCSDVCPMNKNRDIKPIGKFLEDLSFNIDFELTNKELRKKAYGFRGKKVLERNAEILSKNK